MQIHAVPESRVLFIFEDGDDVNIFGGAVKLQISALSNFARLFTQRLSPYV